MLNFSPQKYFLISLVWALNVTLFLPVFDLEDEHPAAQTGHPELQSADASFQDHNDGERRASKEDEDQTNNTYNGNRTRAHAPDRQYSLSQTRIRKWGCHRTESPLIFVHIGKAGGGRVRARFAAAALDYNRSSEEWHQPHLDDHYYDPMKKNKNKAKFCNSKYKNYRLFNTTLFTKSYEGNLPCQATTPIGMALACPEPVSDANRCGGCQDFTRSDCQTVYVGHNSLGNELHWLPPKFLDKWWRSSQWHEQFRADWGMLKPKEVSCCWCYVDSATPGGRPKRFHRPNNKREYLQRHDRCSVPLTEYWDTQFNAFWMNLSGPNTIRNYAPIYASLPVHRVTIVREPWSWLVSKFFWHDYDQQVVPPLSTGDNHTLMCDNIEAASRGWAYKAVMEYIMYLCGEECSTRLERSQVSLQEIQMQTEDNLRHSFSVVGLFNETEVFYDMVTARIAYVDMSRNPQVQGARHNSKRTRDSGRCKKVFATNVTFQEAFRRALPALGTLEYLYQVAVEVNRFQLAELKACEGPGGRLASPTSEPKELQ